jgi:hypothetical protein
MIPSGTKVSCRLEQTISSATADEGQPVQLASTENVKVGDKIVIAQDATCIGTIVEATAKRRMGRTGKLDFSIDKVRSVDGDFIPLRYTMQKKEGGSHATSTGVMTAGAAVLFWPAAPFFLLRKGKDVTINKGIVLQVFTDSDHVLKAEGAAPAAPAAGAAPRQPEVAPATMATAAVTITSDIAGAEVELDGNFIGSTPVTRQVSSGTHRIIVKSGDRIWDRKLDVQGGSPILVDVVLKK